MGASLGAILALTLVVSNAGSLFDTIINSAAPATTLAVFFCSIVAMLGIGSTLTGLIFEAVERH